MALAAGFAHAENEAKESVTLDTVTVKGQATSATHRVTYKTHGRKRLPLI